MEDAAGKPNRSPPLARRSHLRLDPSGPSAAALLSTSPSSMAERRPAPEPPPSTPSPPSSVGPASGHLAFPLLLPEFLTAGLLPSFSSPADSPSLLLFLVRAHATAASPALLLPCTGAPRLPCSAMDAAPSPVRPADHGLAALPGDHAAATASCHSPRHPKLAEMSMVTVSLLLLCSSSCRARGATPRPTTARSCCPRRVASSPSSGRRSYCLDDLCRQVLPLGASPFDRGRGCAAVRDRCPTMTSPS